MQHGITADIQTKLVIFLCLYLCAALISASPEVKTAGCLPDICYRRRMKPSTLKLPSNRLPPQITITFRFNLGRWLSISEKCTNSLPPHFTAVESSVTSPGHQPVKSSSSLWLSTSIKPESFSVSVCQPSYIPYSRRCVKLESFTVQVEDQARALCSMRVRFPSTFDYTVGNLMFLTVEYCGITLMQTPKFIFAAATAAKGSDFWQYLAVDGDGNGGGRNNDGNGGNDTVETAEHEDDDDDGNSKSGYTNYHLYFSDIDSHPVYMDDDGGPKSFPIDPNDDDGEMGGSDLDEICFGAEESISDGIEFNPDFLQMAYILRKHAENMKINLNTLRQFRSQAVMYALYKQAVVGDAPEKSWGDGWIDRKKWAVWDKLRGMEPQEAERLLMEKVEQNHPDWRSSQHLGSYSLKDEIEYAKAEREFFALPKNVN